MFPITATTDEEKALCPIRNVLANVNGKWQPLILLSLEDGPQRFAAVKRLVGDITQRVLTENLRSLQRDGYLTRTVLPGPPLAVVYELTELGFSLVGAMRPLLDWASENYLAVKAARQAHDREMEVSG